MKRLFLSLLALFFMPSSAALACSNIFINQPSMHIDARTMDFGMNVGMEDCFGFIGQKNTTDVIIDATNIPASKLATWTNRYGYWSRQGFRSGKAIEGMNTAGFAFGALYLDTVTKYPAYDVDDKRPALAVFDMGNFLLGTAASVDEAVGLLSSNQIVQSAVEIKSGVFLRNVPLHFTLRDASGDSAVVEFVGGKMQVYHPASNVLTNGPGYPEQLALVKKFDGIDARKDNGALNGMPGGQSSTDRFARASALLRNLPVPATRAEALYQADYVLSSLVAPFFALSGSGCESNTLWKALKDLDAKVVYTYNLLYFQGGGKIAPTSIANGYTVIDLNTIDFNYTPPEYAESTIQPTPPEHVKKIVLAKDIPEFGE